MSGAIDWLFENEDKGIILEDDCHQIMIFLFLRKIIIKYEKDTGYL